VVWVAVYKTKISLLMGLPFGSMRMILTGG